MLPDLPQRIGELPDPVPGDPDSERHRLHIAVSDLLASVARRQPLLLAVEDVHWADGPTLLLLRHLARSAADARMLLLATFRDTPADMPRELSEALVDLRRGEDVVRLALTGLSGDEVVEFVRRSAGGELDPGLRELAPVLSELTDGNAFLMTELWRTLMETGALEIVNGTGRLVRPLAELQSPESVRDVVSDRLSRLEPTTAAVLEAAAVAGAEFALDVVRRAVEVDERTLLAALDESVRSGMIEAVSATAPAYRFTHELVRRALYDRLTALRRAELHLRVGTALEETLPVTPGRGLADVAHHLAAAGSLGDTEVAIDYNLRAARAAMAALAFEQAAAHFRTALALGVKSPSEQAEIQLELGTASHVAGSWADAVAETASIIPLRTDSSSAASSVRSSTSTARRTTSSANSAPATAAASRTAAVVGSSRERGSRRLGRSPGFAAQPMGGASLPVPFTISQAPGLIQRAPELRRRERVAVGQLAQRPGGLPQPRVRRRPRRCGARIRRPRPHSDR